MTTRSHILTAGAFAAVAALAPAAPAVAARPAMLGIQDDRLAHATENPAPRMALVAQTKARLVRVDLRWDLVAASRPARPTSPADAAYDWTHYDRVVAAARARKVNVLFTIWGTPGWAADPAVPVSWGLPAFGRRPRRAADAGAFATAAAKRYAPRGVHMWETWNEPNIPIFWQPQFRRSGGRWVPDSPRAYAAVAKAMYRGIHSVDRRARVAGAVTAPAGEKNPQTCGVQPNCRIMPDVFVRALNARGLRPPMDAVSHHPYPLRPPSNRNFAGASYIDLYNLPRYTSAVDRTYLRGKPIWLTEFGISTRRVPEYPFNTNEANQARWLRDAVTRVRRTPRVKVFVWYLLQDHPAWKSGLLRENGSRKPAFAAFARLAR